MSAPNDDDIDALLDDCLEDYTTQQKEADEKAQKIADEKAASARILEEALHATGGESVNNNANKNNLDNPEQFTQMFSQLANILQQTQQLSENPDGQSTTEQEDRLLQMAKQLIGHAQSSVETDEERQKMASTMSALNRVQELTKQMQQNYYLPRVKTQVC